MLHNVAQTNILELDRCCRRRKKSVAKSLQQVLPATTLYYKACTKHFPVLLGTAQLAQSTFQYYFVLQNLHKARPSTTWYYKSCAKYFPVLLCTTKLAQRKRKNYDSEALFKGIVKGKLSVAKWKKIAAKEPFAAHAATTMRFATFRCKRH